MQAVTDIGIALIAFGTGVYTLVETIDSIRKHTWVLAVLNLLLTAALGVISYGLWRNSLKYYGITDKTAAASKQEPPITRVFEKTQTWKLVTEFEPVAGTSSLYVAVAHSSKDHVADNRFVLLDVRGCQGKGPRIPKGGEDVQITLVDMRVAPSLGMVTDNYFPFLPFVEPDCRFSH